MSVVAPEYNQSKVGQRLQVHFKDPPDAFDWLLVREKEHGKFWIGLHGFISPVIPVLLQLARPQGDVPVLVDLRDQPERYIDLVRRWLEEHEKVRNRLKVATGIWRWRHKEDLRHAIRTAPSQYLIALEMWEKDAWCWRSNWE